MSVVVAIVSACPVCGREPYVEECWHNGPWAVGCYNINPTEHFVGVNGDNRSDAIRAWNIETRTVAATMPKSKGPTT